MRPYELGNPDLDRRVKELVTDAIAGHDEHEHGLDLIREMLVTGLKLLRDDADRGDLKLVNSALKEMRYSFLIFSRYRDTRKATIFGSARTTADEPSYLLASEFARLMTDERGWMVITGAGPGIMEAGNLGAGEDFSFGVNIRLPFEAEANPYVPDSRLINFKYFFTRKLMFVKESDAFALFPGGFGTQDEAFELLTLIQTGKSDLHPILMVDAPDSGYWESWLDFVTGRLLKDGMIEPDDLDLFRLTSDVQEAVDEICGFYANYHSQRYVQGELVLRMQHQPSPELLEELNDDFSDILTGGRIEAIPPAPDEVQDEDHLDLARIRLQFNRQSFGRLRRLIDRLNEVSAPQGASTT
ncbi:MAG: TIGR00730 family Rossman fold protein [Acidimicrobiia bacterium]